MGNDVGFWNGMSWERELTWSPRWRKFTSLEVESRVPAFLGSPFLLPHTNSGIENTGHESPIFDNTRRRENIEGSYGGDKRTFESHVVRTRLWSWYGWMNGWWVRAGKAFQGGNLPTEKYSGLSLRKLYEIIIMKAEWAMQWIDREGAWEYTLVQYFRKSELLGRGLYIVISWKFLHTLDEIWFGSLCLKSAVLLLLRPLDLGLTAERREVSYVLL